MTSGGNQAQKLANKMSKAWINFARYGDPNHRNLPGWPSYIDGKNASMIFDNICNISTQKNWR